MICPICALNACRAASSMGMMNHSKEDEKEWEEENENDEEEQEDN